MIQDQIRKQEQLIFDASKQLETLRKEIPLQPLTKTYVFHTSDGERSLSDLFLGKKNLILIHNMGFGCHWCTAWADGINGVLAHLEAMTSIVLVSKESPADFQKFAQKRLWKFRFASHGGGDFMTDHCHFGDESNYPGASTFVLKDGSVYKRNSTFFGPGDQFNSIFPLASLIGVGAEEVHLKSEY